jgi:hypothetical protein
MSQGRLKTDLMAIATSLYTRLHSMFVVIWMVHRNLLGQNYRQLSPGFAMELSDLQNHKKF